MNRSRLVFSLAMAALAAILLPVPLRAQITFQRTYGGTHVDEGYAVRQTADAGYIVAGLTYSYGAGFADVFLVRTDANGNTLWTKTYGGTMGDEAYAIERTSDGGFIVVGCSSFYDGYVLKTASGDELVQAVRTVHQGGTMLSPAIAAKVVRQVATRRPQQAAGQVEPLSGRELDVLRLAAQGMTNRAIGHALKISHRTVQGHLDSIYGKLGAHSRTEAVTEALKRGWIVIS